MAQEAIVIGLGLSGLMAAKTLAKQGYQVSAFEALDRVGGRIHTIYTPEGHPVDVGASFVSLNNPKDPASQAIQILIEQQKLKTLPVDFLNADCFDSKGHKDDLKKLEPLLWEQFNAVTAKIQEAKKTEWHKPPSIRDILEYYEDNIPPIDSLDYLARKIITTLFTQQYGTHLKNISLLELQTESTLTPSHFIQEGLQGLVQALYEEAKKAGVLFFLNTPVVDIRRESEEGSIQVKTKAGQKYFANTVVVALPLGTLQQQMIQFKPPISILKQKALRHIRVGFHNKVVLTFEKPFWSKTAHFIYPGDNDIDYWPSYFNLYYFSGNKTATLVADLYAKEADFKPEDEKAVLEKVLAPLKKLYGKEFTKPIFTYISVWQSYPIFGSNSYFGLQMTEEDFQELRTAEPGGLFFAGEYTSDNKNSISGAYESGVRAALEAKAYLDRTLTSKTKTTPP